MAKRTELATTKEARLQSATSQLSIFELEQALLKAWPQESGMAGDPCGLLVGNPAQAVQRIAVALDPTIAAIERASELGCNVLLTHHPLYRSSVTRIQPAQSDALCDGAGVWVAVEKGVSIMSFHTALDVSKEAQRVLPHMLNFSFNSVLEPIPGFLGLGYGQVCTLQDTEELTLEELAARCVAVFGRIPRVWGSLNRPCKNIALMPGSGSDFLETALQQGIDCFITGEVKYHPSLSASSAGLAIIELGHDVSELPFCSVLANKLIEIGINPEAIFYINQNSHWTTPEAIRC